MDITFLDVGQVLTIHTVQVRRHGGSAGVRDPGMLESAVEMPRAGFGDQYLHEDLFEMAAAYAFHIVMNHPFVDGNKRTGFHAAAVFLDLNGWRLDLDDDTAYDLVIGVCEGTVTKKGLAEALRSGSAPLAQE
ncbi:MAG: type II toxin-antitoxin system death-on-curing family toxin [Anaerosomatales bacterium]|nr:type II toxin-antitoxin system death-on-curing family toxin [Coriobacteriia bacterium]